MPEPNFDKYISKKSAAPSQPDFLSKYTTNKSTVDNNVDIGDYVAMFVRGAAGFTPGGLIGAGVGGAAELAAQTLEGREHYNYPEVALQAGLNAIPFHGAATIGKAALKGAGLSAVSTGLEQQVKEGVHIPTEEDVKDVALSAAIGGAGGAVLHKGAEFLDKYKKVGTPKEKANAEVHQAVAAVKEEPIKKAVVADSPEVEHAKKKLIALAERKNLGPLSVEEKAEAASLRRYIGSKQVPTTEGRAKRIRKNSVTEGEDILDQVLLGGDVVDPKTGEVISTSANETPKVDLQTAAPRARLDGLPTVDRTPKGIEVYIPESIRKHIPRKEDGSINWLSVANAPKAMAASADLSAPLRQGMFLAGRKEWRDAWGPMIRSLRQGGFEAESKAIAQHPRFEEALENGIKFTQSGAVDAGEEQFASNLAEKIWFIGPNIIKPSEQAYTTFLNKLRMDMYGNLVDKAERLKAPVDKNKLASYINSATGRGNMALTTSGKSEAIERATAGANAILFSPRFIASRIQLLNPASYMKMDPFTRREALRDLATMTGMAGATLGLAKAGGAEVDFDPRSVDFGKVKIGNTRIDTLAGFGQYIRLMAQTANHLYDNKKKGPDLKRFAESKLSPTARMVMEMTSGKDYFGKDISIPKSALNGFAPMITRDIADLIQSDNSVAADIGLSGLSGLGIPVQTYGDVGRPGRKSMFSPTRPKSPFAKP